MLIEFSVENYMCFKDKVTLSMVAAPINEHQEDNIFYPPNFKYGLLKSAVVYGANASGKSNLFEAMRFMKKFIISSSKDTQANEMIPIEPFRLSQDTEKKCSSFEISFILDRIRYRYGFELTTEKICSEWLYYTPDIEKARERKLFVREYDKIELSS